MVASAHTDGLLLAVGLSTAAATMLGGAMALRFASRLHLVLGFSAGAVIAVAVLDLLPEALRLAPVGGAAKVAVLVAAGVLVYFVLAQVLARIGKGAPAQRGHFGAASLTAHSLLDGLAIGFGFQASMAIGFALAVAVLTHDLCDGFNTVNISLSGSGNATFARRWLIADAAAPLLGIAASRLIALKSSDLGPLIAVFAGFLLYIGAGDLLPESQKRRPGVWTATATALGFVLIWGVVRVTGP